MSKYYWTDYPFNCLGDVSYKIAPIRKINLISFDYDKYVKIEVEGHLVEIKAGFIYTEPKRLDSANKISMKELYKLPETK